MSGANRSKDHRKLAAGIACGGILLAGLAAGSHRQRAVKPGVTSPLETTSASTARTSQPSFLPASSPLERQPLAISHPAKRTLSPKSSASDLRSAAASPPTISPVARAQALKTYAALPMMFEANNGQTDSRVKFLSRAPGYTLFLTDKEAVLSLPAGSPASASAHRGQHFGNYPGPQPEKSEAPNLTRTVRLKFAGGNTPTAISGRDQLPGKTNYFLGNDPKQWRTNVPNYSAVEYRGIYSGVDALFRGDNRRLEFDFNIAPGADPHTIALEVDGARRVRLNREGDVLLGMDATRDVVMGKPHIYQQSPEGRREIAGHYVLTASNRIAFALGPYDHAQPLVIDPTMTYSTYLGGGISQESNINAIAVDSSGDAYVTGTVSADTVPFPTTPGSYNPGPVSGNSSFITKLKTDGSGLVYSTYFGGVTNDYTPTPTAGDQINSIAVDSSGAAYFGGLSQSSDTPTTPGSFMPIRPSDYTVPFVAKLSQDGSTLVYSTYLDGTPNSTGDNVGGIAVDSLGSAYVTGVTTATNFPTTPGAFQTVYKASLYLGTAFVTKLSADGSSLVYSTYLGGSTGENDVSQIGGTAAQGAIAVDSSKDAYVTGFTQSTDFPTTTGAYSVTCGSPCQDVFATKVNANGTGLVYSTFLGGGGAGNKYSVGRGIAVDSAGSAFVGGTTNTPTFPVTSGALQTSAGVGFITKLTKDGTSLQYSSYFGGYVMSVAVGADDSAVLFGLGNTTYAFDSTPDAFTIPGCRSTTGCFYDFISKLTADGSALIFSSPIGADQECCTVAGALDPAGNGYIAGSTGSQDLFTTPGSFEPSLPSNYSGFTPFVAKIAFSSSTPLTLSPTTLPPGTAGVAYSVTFTATGTTGAATFAVTAGSLPSSFSFSSAGMLSGAPAQTGTFPFTVTATDSVGDAGSQAYTLIINCPTITVGPGTLANGIVGAAYPAVAFTETGGLGAITFSETGLPSGIGMTFTAGVLSGTPTTSESFPITVTATDSNSCSGNITNTLTINSSTITPAYVTDNETITVTDTPTFPDVADSEAITVNDAVTVRAYNAISISPSTVVSGVLNQPYTSLTFVGSGGFGGLTLSESGPVPSGMAFNSFGASIRLSGTPTTLGSGSWPFTITATDSAGDAVTQSYTLTIAGACPSISVMPTSLSNLTLGTAFSQPFTESGGVGIITWLETGTLPPGLSFVGGLLSGSPTQAGNFSFTIVATDENSCTGNVSFSSLSVAPAPASVIDNETITVTDTPTFPDVADSETITVTDQVSITVSQSQTITFGAAPTVVVGGSGTLSATASSGLPVTFSSTTPAICSVAGSTVTGLAVGPCIVAANQAGNASYSPAPQVTQTISISASTGLSPAILTFADQLVRSTSATQTVTLTNAGTAAVTVGAITTTADFTHPSKTCTATLAAGSSCTISVAFAPKAAGVFTGTLTVGANGTVALSGTGIVPSASIAPATYTFKNQQVDTTSGVQTFTYTNTGLVSITVSSVTLTGAAATNYVIASDLCTGVSLAAAATCDVGVTFTPSVAKNRVATLTVTDETGGAAKATASLSGTGVAATASLTGNAAFGSQQVGVTSPAQTLTYENTGLGAISVNSAALRGKAATDYVIATDTCTGATLAASASCSIGLTFIPSAVGSRAASLTVTDSTGGATAQSLSLSGTGIAPTISLGSGTYAYGAVTVATKATFTLTNSGTAPLVISTIALTTGTQFKVTGGTCTVGGSVSNGGSCSVIVTFTPSGKTTFTDTLTVQGTGVGTGAPTYTASRAMTGH